MRITFYKNIKTMSGKCKDGRMVFQSKRNDSVCIGRNHVYPIITEHNTHTGNKMKAAAIVWKQVPENFKQDLQTYANAFNSQHQPERKLKLGAYNVFIKAVCSYLTPLDSLADVALALGNTISEWIDNAYLKSVNTTVPFLEELTN